MTNVAVLFGGRSAEHEVSILTAHEAMAVLAEMPGYTVVPIYISKGGRWLTGKVLEDLDKFAHPEQIESECTPLVLRPMDAEPLATPARGLMRGEKPLSVDVALPLLHGPNGEDGTLQGLLELLGIPYAGSGVLASAMCMDKVAMKERYRCLGLPQARYVSVTQAEWTADNTAARGRIADLGEAVFVKPSRGGSSIGVTAVKSSAELDDAIELALTFDHTVVVEAAVVGAEEVNCAVLRRGDEVTTSVLELVRSKDGFLSYDEKYMQWSKGAPLKGPAPAKGAPRKGAAAASAMEGHLVPAPLDEAKTAEIRSLAVQAFDACGCDGVARVDFLLDGENVLVNEVNTLPGSLAFYLWEASGLSFDQLLDGMLKSAIEAAKDRASITYSLDTNLLAEIEARKGAKRPQ